MSSLSERKSRIFKDIKEEMMAAGATGFTGAAAPEGPVAGYDPLMGKTDKVLKKHRKKKGINEETFKEKQAAARKRLEANKKAVESGKEGDSPYGKHLPKKTAAKDTDPWSTNPDTVKVQKKLDKLSEARDGKSAKDKGYSLHDWFKGGGWKQAGGKYDGKPCAKQPGQTTKPFCRDADDRANMSKDERDRRAAKKRREDPNADRKGKAKMVHEENLEEKKNCWPGYEKKGTKKMFGKEYNNCVKKEETEISEGKKDACYHKVKARYDVWPSAYASGALVKCRKKGASNWGNKSKKKD
ncbi:hypothetical protein SCREM2_gp160 [Synechococcus phage S-CREM2]|nr:hypothetical protein SCREM2_gp160 [Synechococcus phage S-CREM2]